jgi:hypothetical protein
MATELNYRRILEDTSSFQVVRTNPKLTGNVKLTIDSNDKMWLNSIDANEEMSKDIYKRVAIDPEISLPGNMYRFFNSGTTPPELVFSLTEAFDSNRTSKDYKDQFDFSHYFSGAKYFPSRRYEERLSYFAPLFIKRDLPDYFVIFKIDGPVNKEIDQLTSEYPYDRESYLKDLFSSSTLIKTFDLRESTKVGRYLREYRRDDNFPSAPLNVKYTEDSYTSWNGILYDSGVFGSREELISSFYQESHPLKHFEEVITAGFERNGVILADLLNLEFIFNDDTSDAYDFNRYFGVYVNTIELTKLDIDLDRAYAERATWENTPRLRREYDEAEEVRLDQSNPDGVIIPVKGSSFFLSDLSNIFQDGDNMFFNYVKDKDGNLRSPKLDSPYDIDYDDQGNELLSAKIRMSDRDLDLGKMFGPSSTFLQEEGFVAGARGFSHAYIRIDQLSHGDAIRIYHLNGTRTDSNGKYDEIVALSGSSIAPDPGDSYIYNDIDDVLGFDVFYFNIDGLQSEISSALTRCINGVRRKKFFAYAFNEYVFIKCSVPGDYDSTMALSFQSIVGLYSGIEINGSTGNALIGSIYQFEGGSQYDRNRLVIDVGHRSKIESNLSDLLVKTETGWSRISKISRYVDLVTESNSVRAVDRANAISEFFGKLVLVLESDSVPDVEFKQCLIKRKHRPSFGFLSMFPIKDFDFDFYSSEYLNFPLNDIYKYYFIPAGVSMLSSDFEYEVFGQGTVEIDGVGQFSTGQTVALPPSTSTYSYSVVEGDPFLGFSTDLLSPGSRLDIPINDENRELRDFSGFFLLKDPNRVQAEQDDLAFQLRQKYLNGIARSEYDFYKENFVKNYANRSKILPYITKWVIPDGTDSRSNPYRLNTELAFGFNNFSPDHEDRSQNPSNFTHEWYYLESRFNFIEDRTAAAQNNSYFEEPFDLNLAVTDSDYFVNYFTYTPTFNGEEVERTQTRYSPIRKDFLGRHETFFKGFRIRFNDYIDGNNLAENGKPLPNSNSTRFEDYRFTALLRAVPEDINDPNTPPVRFRFIEHQTFKFIILLVEVSLGSIGEIDDYWKEPGAPLVTTVDRNNFLDNYGGLQNFTQMYDSINGEYRINFETINGQPISDLTYTFLYALKHKKFNNTLNNYSNVKLSSKLNLNTSGAFNSGSFDIIYLPNLSIPVYPSKLSDEISRPNPDTFIVARNFTIGFDEFIDYTVGGIPQNESKLASASPTLVTYSEQDPNIQLINQSGVITNPVPNLLPASVYQDVYHFKVIKMGELYYENLFQKISFGDFKNRTNSLDPFIEYYSYSFDGTNAIQEVTNWYSEISDTSNIIKKDALITQVDEDRPSNLSAQNVIGFAYEKVNLDNSYEINRYDGGFSPLFKELFTFNSKLQFQANQIEALESANIRFNIGLDRFLNLQNFSHIKVSDRKILDLESDEQFDPNYDLVGETAIGRADYFLLGSNWDYGFHYKYSGKNARVPVAGSLRVEEDNCFVSKIINLKESIELEQFSVQIAQTIEEINIDDIEIAYVQGESSIEGYINVNNVITSYLIGDGIQSKFDQYLVNQPEYIGNYESIEQYTRDYIKINLLKLYEIESVELYTKDDPTLVDPTGETGQNLIQFEFLNDTQRFDQGFKLNRSSRINKKDRLILKFELNKKLNSGTSVSPKIKIKFI